MYDYSPSSSIFIIEWCEASGVKCLIINLNVPAGWVGKVQKNYLPKEEGRKGGWRKKGHAACPPGPVLEPGACHVLGEGPQLHAMGVVQTS